MTIGPSLKAKTNSLAMPPIVQIRNKKKCSSDLTISRTTANYIISNSNDIKSPEIFSPKTEKANRKLFRYFKMTQ